MRRCLQPFISYKQHTHMHTHTQPMHKIQQGSAANQLLPAGPSKQQPEPLKGPQADGVQQGRLHKRQSKPRLMCSQQSSARRHSGSSSIRGNVPRPKSRYTRQAHSTHVGMCMPFARGGRPHPCKPTKFQVSSQAKLCLVGCQHTSPTHSGARFISKGPTSSKTPQAAPAEAVCPRVRVL